MILLLLDDATYRFGAIYGLFGSFQMSLKLGVSCTLHENFTEYDEFLFCGAEELSFWVKCYFTTTVGTVLHSSFCMICR